MSNPVTPTDLAAFLRDISEITTTHQRTISDQTKNGFAVWAAEVSALPGVTSPFMNPRGEATTRFLEVEQPKAEPTPPRPDATGEVDPVEAEKYEIALKAWRTSKKLYDDLFAARTPADSMELVVAFGLLVTRTEKGEIRRHVCTAPVEVELDRSTGKLGIEIIDAVSQEINWTPGEIRSRLTERGSGFLDLIEAQEISEIHAAVADIAAGFGTSLVPLDTPTDPARAGSIGFASHPALLLRRRDTSALLDLLRTMTDDMASGGHVSDPFKMLVSPDFKPAPLEVQNDRAALPLSANVDQREMIERARSSTHLVIQGPPGTGKTHTIANLAAVLMAEGRRVLVTAENERALSEVQSKLPPAMQPLMLPMFRERSTGSLEGSVNVLSTRSGGGSTAESRAEEILKESNRLAAIETATAQAEDALRRLADADRAPRTFGAILPMALEGHLRSLESKSELLDLVDRFFSDQTANPEDAETVLRLHSVVTDSHEAISRYRLPEDLIDPSEFSETLQRYRSQLALLGDPLPFDHSVFADKLDGLQLLSNKLQQLPPVPWGRISRTPAEYLIAAMECTKAAADVNHGVTVGMTTDRTAAIALLEAYLSLEPLRFDRRISELFGRVERAQNYASLSDAQGKVLNHGSADELVATCVAARSTLQSDRSGLLSTHVNQVLTYGQSGITLLAEESRRLAASARAPIGLPVVIAPAAPPANDLLDQARQLQVHLSTGGKLTGLLRPPKAVRDAAPLLEHVRVNGSAVDTFDEATRVVEYLEHQLALTVIDEWADQHNLARPSHMPHHEWLAAIQSVPADSAQVIKAVELVDQVVEFPYGRRPSSATDILMGAIATVSREELDGLSALADLALQGRPEIRISGNEVLCRADAEIALKSLAALHLRDQHLSLLPEEWSSGCSASETRTDELTKRLSVCADAAAVPSGARHATLSPSALIAIIEQSGIDQRRKRLIDDHHTFVNGQLDLLAVCAPKSTATRALVAAIETEDPAAYRAGTDALADERAMAELFEKFKWARFRITSAHPVLMSAFLNDAPEALYCLVNLSELQTLRDHRLAAREWQSEISQVEEIHLQLAELHRERRKSEARVAELRCWSSAIERLQSRRELRSALSALTIALGKVPKTRSAKTYPARIRALKEATQAAAPAIPCWVLTIDRVAEVLGYPTGEHRFDVVIVDESSQAWFPAIFLYAIADQVIVVGDDLQTSPAEAIASESEIRSIVDEHIRGHRFANQVGTDLSLYDVAAMMTGPDTMSDHFRCVPEIIDLSNRLSYAPKGKRLEPIRVREPRSLDPVKQIQVAGRRTSSAAANDPEIEAIIDAVATCHADPAYAGLDFGVVVVGSNSIAHIQGLRTRLLDVIGPIAMELRNLEVGTPSEFQGAERNVMFLSLIEAPAPGERIRKWPHEHTGRNRKRVQQLNVAVSRARDQLWIFRSFGLDALAPDDARAVILTPPPAEQISLENQLAQCQSEFERHVVHAIHDADPTLIIRTQVPAIGYSIDIVIEDPEGRRLAIECDGDRWHSENKDIRADLYRQRTLENVGWRFYRFLASEWYANPTEHLDEIFRHLVESDDQVKVQSVTHLFSSPSVEPSNDIPGSPSVSGAATFNYPGTPTPSTTSRRSTADEEDDGEPDDDSDPWGFDEQPLFFDTAGVFGDELADFALIVDWSGHQSASEDDDVPVRAEGTTWDDDTDDEADEEDDEEEDDDDDNDGEEEELWANDDLDEDDDDDQFSSLTSTSFPEPQTEPATRSASSVGKPRAVVRKKPATRKAPAKRAATKRTQPKVADPVPLVSEVTTYSMRPPISDPVATRKPATPAAHRYVEMTTKERNRALAAAMRDLGIEPNGDAWELAKVMLANGATFDEAAAVAAREIP